MVADNNGRIPESFFSGIVDPVIPREIHGNVHFTEPAKDPVKDLLFLLPGDRQDGADEHTIYDQNQSDCRNRDP
jgi:hypothetical protein